MCVLDPLEHVTKMLILLLVEPRISFISCYSNCWSCYLFGAGLVGTCFFPLRPRHFDLFFWSFLLFRFHVEMYVSSLFRARGNLQHHQLLLQLRLQCKWP